MWKRIFLGNLLIPFFLHASHNRGGEITYEHIGGLTYSITIKTCTDPGFGGNQNPDREELIIDFDLGTSYAVSDTFQRTSQQLVGQYKENEYTGTHTFSSPGLHTLSVEDPNRNAGIININSSDQIVFALKSVINISAFLGPNSSIQFDECPCPEIACVNKPYVYNPMGYDPDGDSLSYALVYPLGQGAMALANTVYSPPNLVPQNAGSSFGIDPLTGTVFWSNPQMQGEYNFTIKITEWRNGFEIGYVIRDVQLTVTSQCPNNPPSIVAIPDQCVNVDDTLNFVINGSDPNQDFLSISSSGLPFNLASNPATFAFVNGNGYANGVLNWRTTCSHIRQAPYLVNIQLTDNGNPTLSDFESFNIKVRPPELEGLNISAVGNAVSLTWNKPYCNNATGYSVYRKVGAVNSTLNCCDNPGIANNLGMTLIHQTANLNDTVYTDNNNLNIDQKYCYVVTAMYDYDQVESCPTDTVCVVIKNEIPILNNVSVVKTGVSDGIDSIVWYHPFDLDTTLYLPPYHYRVKNDSGQIIYQGAPSVLLQNLDTSFNFVTNTTDTNRFYSVGIYYNANGIDTLLGESEPASSVHLSTVPNDNQIELFWNFDTPWNNNKYYVYRSDSLNGFYTLLDSTFINYYLDSGLINQKEYCYFIQSVGTPSYASLNSPVRNLSQKVCDIPFDFTPPPPPDITTNSDSNTTININGRLVYQSLENCELGFNSFSWTNPNNFGSDDAVSYQLYFQPFLDSSFRLIHTFNSIFDTSYQHYYTYQDQISVAGCYYITALDSVPYNNESAPSDTICFDNCPLFELPNIFTPNRDGNNDAFQALLPIRYVSGIDLNLFNRWGDPVFKATSPLFTWDGIHQESQLPLPSGIYYYTCIVETLRLQGIVNQNLNGFTHLVRDFNNQD